MIVFPTFIIIPTAVVLFRRSPRLRDLIVMVVPFILAGASLAIAVVFADLYLLNIGGAGSLVLVVLLSVLTVAILCFLPILGSYVLEMNMLRVYREASQGSRI